MSRSSLGVVACVAGLALVARAQFFNFNIGIITHTDFCIINILIYNCWVINIFIHSIH